MSTLAEIESAIKQLPLSEKSRLLKSLGNALPNEQTTDPGATKAKTQTPSVLDIPVVSIGRVLRPDLARADLLEEMLEERI